MIHIRYLSNYKVVQLSLHHLFILPIDKLTKVCYNSIVNIFSFMY